MIETAHQLDYYPSPTIARFQSDHESFVRGIMGPIGSGKSVGCSLDLISLAYEMPPDLLGRRRQRNVVVRNTYRELQDTTIRTVFEWMPKDEPSLGCHWSESDLSWVLVSENDGLEIEWLFRALDRPDHVAKLLSLELTHAWVNEAREVPLAIINMLQGRLGRFPSMRDYGWRTDPEAVAEMLKSGRVPVVGVDIPYWYGMMMDTNPCDEDHWWYRHFEELRPEGWRLYRQPSAESPDAENLTHLQPLYYHRLKQGKTPEWVRVYVRGEYGFVQDGRQVWPEYVDSVHCLEKPLDPMKGVEVVMGADWGLTPAVVYLQQYQGTWIVMHETVATRLGAVNLAKEVRRTLDTVFRGCPVRQGWGDPSGGEGSSQIDEGETVIEVMRDSGLPFDPAPSQDHVRRRESVGSALSDLTVAGRPRLLISPACRQLRKGAAGGYRYRRLQVAGDERFTDKPDKNVYSHVCEALEYAMLGEGEGYNLIEREPSVDASGLPRPRNQRVETMAQSVRARSRLRERRIRI